jgi:hypothetical protein
MPDQPSLAGSRARLDRADALIGEFEAATKAFAATRPYRAALVPDVNPVNRRFVFESELLRLHRFPLGDAEAPERRASAVVTGRLLSESPRRALPADRG